MLVRRSWRSTSSVCSVGKRTPSLPLSRVSRSQRLETMSELRQPGARQPEPHQREEGKWHSHTRERGGAGWRRGMEAFGPLSQHMCAGLRLLDLLLDRAHCSQLRLALRAR